MKYNKYILESGENFKITYHANSTSSQKLVITFGEIDASMEEEGFAYDLIIEQGFDHIYVAQKKQTQYQFLSATSFKQIIYEVIANKKVYTYGSSLGGYAALYYGGSIDANILAMSPRIPAHPVIDKLMGRRFKNKGFYHTEIYEKQRSSQKVIILYDQNNYIDNYFVNFYLKMAYPDASYYYVDNAGHYPARALQISGELKKVAMDFFYDRQINYSLDESEILNWHCEKAEKRINKGKLYHARENLEVILNSNLVNDNYIRNLVTLHNSKWVTKFKSKKQSSTKLKNKSRVNKFLPLKISKSIYIFISSIKKLLSTTKLIFKYFFSKRKNNRRKSRDRSSTKIFPLITKNESNRLEKAVSISFVGDLILLRDQVLNSYNHITNRYDFDFMFNYVKKYLDESDFSIGVLEGPAAGDGYEFSTSTYADRIPIHLNYPDTFIEAISRAGFDFLTTAQNHMFDCGVSGAMRTLDLLDQVNIAHRGCYRNINEKESLPIYNIQGLKVAILTYTKRSNRYTNSFFLDSRNKYLTSLLVSPEDDNFLYVKQAVLNDFDQIKKENPDCIMVISHMGKQFRHTPDKYQNIWCDIFVEAGANLILNNHPHAVQPYEWRKSHDGSDILILHCPGNFVNSYTKKDGDASALSQIFLNPATGKPFAVGNVPLYAHSYVDGNYRPLPIYDIVNLKKIRKHISVYEFSRIKKVHELISNVMLGEKLTIDQVQYKYYLFADRAVNGSKGYVRNHVRPLKLSDELIRKKMYELLSKACSVCFVGDSVTEGTRNGGYGWFEPLIENFEHLEIYRFAKGSATIKYFLKNAEKFASLLTDVYIFAVGVNDVRYRDPGKCAMTETEYINIVNEIINNIKSHNRSAKIVFVAPWTTDKYDPISKLPKEERFEMLVRYRKALQQYAKSNNIMYIDPNETINSTLSTRHPSKWLKDHIHPNANEGIQLYSWAVLSNSP